MLSDPVAEAFGLIHRHHSGENFCRAQERDVLFYTEWAYKHFVITVAVHKMDFEAVE